MTEFRLLYVTTKDEHQAHEIAEALLERRLIACANVLSGMQSIYRWKGKIERGHEVVLILKTVAAQVEAATKAIEELHSYDTPCVLELQVASGAAKYLTWLKAETE